LPTACVDPEPRRNWLADQPGLFRNFEQDNGVIQTGASDICATGRIAPTICSIEPLPENILDKPNDSVMSGNEDPRIQQAYRHMESLLIPGEKIEAFAVQRRLFALKHRRIVVAATTGRFIGMERQLFGGFHPITVRWQDLSDVQLQVGTFGADLTIAALSSPDLAMSGVARAVSFTGLRKAEAEAVYRLCQANEQAWREKRRIRELEELRAKSGGFQLGAGNLAQGAAAAGDDANDPVKKLERAKAMLAKGLITDAEYESLKARIVSNL
jgi:hypothetical protein